MLSIAYFAPFSGVMRAFTTAHRALNSEPRSLRRSDDVVCFGVQIRITTGRTRNIRANVQILTLNIVCMAADIRPIVKSHSMRLNSRKYAVITVWRVDVKMVRFLREIFVIF